MLRVLLVHHKLSFLAGLVNTGPASTFSVKRGPRRSLIATPATWRDATSAHTRRNECHREAIAVGVEGVSAVGQILAHALELSLVIVLEALDALARCLHLLLLPLHHSLLCSGLPLRQLSKAHLIVCGLLLSRRPAIEGLAYTRRRC